MAASPAQSAIQASFSIAATGAQCVHRHLLMVCPAFYISVLEKRTCLSLSGVYPFHSLQPPLKGIYFLNIYILKIKYNDCAGYGWTKMSQKHCGSQHGITAYHSLHAAKKACVSTNPPCRAVYDSQCDGRGNFYLCNRDATLQSSSVHSCVYESTRPHTNKPCTCANGTPAAGAR